MEDVPDQDSAKNQEPMFKLRFACPSSPRYVYIYGCVRLMVSVLWTKFQPPTLEDKLVCRPTAGGRRPPAGRRAPAWARWTYGPHGPHGPHRPHWPHGPHIQFDLRITSSFLLNRTQPCGCVRLIVLVWWIKLASILGVDLASGRRPPAATGGRRPASLRPPVGAHGPRI